MVEDRPQHGSPARPRKATLAERRERRAAVEDVGVVLDAAAGFLEARPRSVSEVRRRLVAAGYRTDLVAAAIERLTQLRYLDDDAFARAWVESRDRARPRGEHALRRELAIKGVDRSLVDAVLADRRETAHAGAAAVRDEAPTPPDDAAAERLLRRKLPAILREPDLRRRRQRAYALLARNGFSPDVCSAVARRVIDAQDADVADAADDDTTGDEGSI